MKLIYTLSITLACLFMSSQVVAQCCNYTLELNDSWGDGWNGASLDITNGGLNIGNYAASGTGSTFTLTLCQGDNISLIYSSGSFENENTYTLTGPDGTVLFSDGPNPTTGTAFSFNVLSCPTCTDGIQNGGETGIDCGGCNCGPCGGAAGAPSNATINSTANIYTLPCGGGSVNLSANGDATVPVFDNNFNDGTAGSGWNVTPAAQFDNPCGAGPNGTHLWMGSATAAPRTLQTAALDLACGGELCFSFRYNEEGGGDTAPCEGADEYDEGVNLQFSTDCGAGWTDLAYFAPNGDLLVSNPNTSAPGATGTTNFTVWDEYCFTLPPAAAASNVTFQWYQSGSSGPGFDHWGIDEVTIDANACDPYYVDWEHLPGAPDAQDVTANVTQTTDFPVIYTNGINDTVYDTVTIFVDAVQNPLVNITTELCAGDNDASASISVTGGTAPYDFELFLPGGGSTVMTVGSPANFTNLSPGNYTAVITDQNGCSVNLPFNIAAGPVCCEVSASGTDLDCNQANAPCDGTITATPSNGVAPYSYQWYTGAGTGSPIGGATNAVEGGMCPGTYTVQLTDNTGCVITDQVSIIEPTAVTLNGAATVVSCNGGADGEITLNAAGGTPGYTYELENNGAQASNVFTGLTAGSYNMTAYDLNGCSETILVNVTENTPVNLSIDGTVNEICGSANGEISLSATGGTGPYNYDIGTANNTTGNFTGLSVGTYNITVTDAFGCTDTGVATISNDGGPTGSVNSLTNVGCNGGSNGSVIIGVAGGTSPYTYSLNGAAAQASNSFTNIAAGAHAVTITDANGCINVVNFNIIEPVQLTYTTALTPASCAGICDGEISFTSAGGTAPYEYSTDNGLSFSTANPITGLCAGNYNLVVRDASGCLANSNVVISEPANLTLVLNTADATCGFDNGTADFIIGGGSGAGYQLDFNNTGFGTTYNFTALDAGSYPYTITDGSGCTQDGFADISDLLGASIQVLATTDPDCYAAPTGEITVETIDGTPLINYFLNSVPYGPSNTAPVEGYYWTGLPAQTHFIHIEDANGCETYQTVTLTEPPQIQYTTISQDVLCNGDATAFVQINATGGVGGFTYSIDNGANYSGSNFFNGLGAGTYDIVIQDADNCLFYSQEIVNEPAPLAYNSTPTDLVCNGVCEGQIEFINTTGGTLPYVYSIDNGTTSSVNPTFTDLCAGAYNLLLTDDNGCTLAANENLAEPTDVIASSVIVDETCNASNGQIDGSAVGGNAPYTFALDNGVPLGAGQNSFTGLAADTYELMAIDANGCLDSIDVVVATFDTPQITVVNFTNPICNGNADGTITITANGGIAPLQYSIDGVTYQPSNNFTGLNAGAFTVYVQDANGCIDTDNAVLTDPTVVSIDNVATSPVDCFGNSTGGITVTVSGGTPGYTYDFGTGFQASNSISFIPAGNYNITVQDANLCQATDVAVVTEPAVLAFDPNVTSTDASCFGTCDGTVNAPVTGGTGAYIYNWSSNIAPANANNATGVCAGTYSVIVSDLNGCQISDMNIIVNEPPLVVITNVLTDSVNCFGESTGEVIVTAPNATTYILTGAGVNMNQANGNFTGLPAGNYDIEVQDANGCSAFSNATVYEPALLTITSNSDITQCFGGELVISAAVFGGNGGYVYNWSNGGTNSVEYIYPTASEYITVSVTDALGCTAGPVGFNVDVSPEPSLNPIADVYICPGEVVPFTGQAVDGQPQYQYQWLHEADTSATTSVSPMVATTYTLTMRDECDDRDTITVNVFMNPVPQLDLLGADNGCLDHSVNLSIDDPMGVIAGGCTWNFGDGTSSNQCNNVSHTYTSSGTYSVQFQFTTAAGCDVDTTYVDVINVYDNPIAEFTFNPFDPTILNSTVNFTNTSIDADTYSWDFAGLGTSSQSDPTYTFPSNNVGNYDVCLTAYANYPDAVCSSVYCAPIVIADDFTMYVPNTFTPDQDDFNPTFKAEASGNDIYAFEMLIFDRWGELIFESHDQTIGWDGTYGGKIVQQGTYVWKITTKLRDKDERRYFTGHVNLLR